MKRRGYLLYHRQWGALSWSPTDRRLISHTTQRIGEALTGMASSTVFATVPAFRRALNATVERLNLDPAWLDEIEIVGVSGDVVNVKDIPEVAP